MDLGAYLDAARAFDGGFRARWAPVTAAAASEVDGERLAAAWAEYTGRLQDNYPYFHPRYAGQMLKPPHPVAIAGYLAAMTVNPNNHALDGGPATGAMEKEVVADLAAMFGLPAGGLGHLTSSGTIANLEALWVGRQLAPGRRRRPQPGGPLHPRPHVRGAGGGERAGGGRRGRADGPGRPGGVLATGQVGTVVLTAGTTGLGVVDPIAEALALRDRYGCRLHVDAAYGGFFTLLARRRRRGRCWARRRRRGYGRWGSATRWWSTPTSTACSRTAAGRCCSATRRWAGCTATTRPTPTSPPTSCTWARSAWSARGPGRPPAPCG